MPLCFAATFSLSCSDFVLNPLFANFSFLNRSASSSSSVFLTVKALPPPAAIFALNFSSFSFSKRSSSALAAASASSFSCAILAIDESDESADNSEDLSDIVSPSESLELSLLFFSDCFPSLSVWPCLSSLTAPPRCQTTNPHYSCHASGFPEAHALLHFVIIVVRRRRTFDI